MVLYDQTGHKIGLNTEPKRIVSVVPSQTELLYSLGLGQKVVARTRFCIHPKNEVKLARRVGGTKTLKLDKIEALQPDLVVANMEENEQEQIEYLQKRFPVYVSKIETIADALQMIEEVADLAGASAKGQELSRQIAASFGNLPQFNASVAYLIWYNPIMAVANHTFINSMLSALSLHNVFAGQNRYPQLDINELAAAQPQYLFLSSEPFPFAQKHVDEFREKLPETKIILVDGEMFSWYGSRLLLSAEYFYSLYHVLQP